MHLRCALPPLVAVGVRVVVMKVIFCLILRMVVVMPMPMPVIVIVAQSDQQQTVESQATGCEDEHQPACVHPGSVCCI